VVVADDDDAVRGLVKSILRRAGYQVLEAANGEAALALIEKIGGTLDLLVTDCIMPKLDGPGLVRAMRAKYPNVPVVYITGYASDLNIGGSGDPRQNCAIVVKPFMPKQFLNVVHGTMSKSPQA
jgi:two-component system cell cycle sensor histidine kinase/response regulator CckA